MTSRASTKYTRNAIWFVAGGLLLFVWVIPLIWAVIVSLKSESEVLAYPPSIFFEPTLQNYRDALFGGVSILPSLGTSMIVSTATTVLTIVIAVPAAYAFARLNLRGKKWLGFYTLATQMVPPVGLVIPYFLILNKVGWLDSYQGMVTVYLTFSLPFAIWLLVSYMEDIPWEMEEAAFLDKANRFQTLWYVILPQVRGGIAVTVIFIFLNAWNEFLFAVQLGGNTVRPVTVAMYNFVSVEQTLWAKLSAAALVAMVPMIIIGIAAQKQIVKGLTVGAVKGGGRR
ncbi:carbohydrate ABC transporter permease [Pelagibius sp. Alg239-R121]|uniref:carbohydrate ABC transporter permease n=1 Tax=Pelagibius sp. Alg239-R121 TaxID=2993448 RepID=UPI0024A6CF77|nr:carbohydrate ABC transporter permease [Pelagibius sp. Alg239-R121]